MKLGDFKVEKKEFLELSPITPDVSIVVVLKKLQNDMFQSRISRKRQKIAMITGENISSLEINLFYGYSWFKNLTLKKQKLRTAFSNQIYIEIDETTSSDRSLSMLQKVEEPAAMTI